MPSRPPSELQLEHHNTDRMAVVDTHYDDMVSDIKINAEQIVEEIDIDEDDGFQEVLYDEIDVEEYEQILNDKQVRTKVRDMLHELTDALEKQLGDGYSVELQLIHTLQVVKIYVSYDPDY